MKLEEELLGDWKKHERKIGETKQLSHGAFLLEPG